MNERHICFLVYLTRSKYTEIDGREANCELLNFAPLIRIISICGVDNHIYTAHALKSNFSIIYSIEVAKTGLREVAETVNN